MQAESKAVLGVNQGCVCWAEFEVKEVFNCVFLLVHYFVTDGFD